MNVHFSSERQTWETPIEFFREVDKEFGFTLDAAADEQNSKCLRFYDGATADSCGLTQPWVKWTWCNPPYGRDIKHWVAKGYEEGRKGNSNVLLIPARTDTRYFHQYIWNIETHFPRLGVEVRFLKGRLKFGDATNAAPFPSMLVINWGL